MRNLYLVANWKMNKTIAETEEFLTEFLPNVKDVKNKVIICPSFLAIAKAVELTKGTKVKIGSQNVHFEESGTYTGEVSVKMLSEVGAEYVIVGHSERRKNDNETNEKVNKKLNLALDNNIIPILCVGETAREKEQGRTYRVLKKQILLAFNEILDPTKVIIAYEPLWAISDGKTPAPTPTIEEIRSVNSGIKRVLRQIYTAEQVKEIKILYGGSVNGKNAYEIMSERSVNGALIGGASLSAQKYLDVIKAVE